MFQLPWRLRVEQATCGSANDWSILYLDVAFSDILLLGVFFLRLLNIKVKPDM